MNILSHTYDKRIATDNYFIEMSYQEYLSVANDIIDNNPYQRRRVNRSTSIYSQLKQDMKTGCIFPPIVLALNNEGLAEIVQRTDLGLMKKQIEKNMKNMLILDGLQRTYTMIDAAKELKNTADKNKFMKNKIRAEIYFDINRFGTLYRMLTLNTGQTPMSLRHQIEILYSDLRLVNDGIYLIPEAEGKTPSKMNVGEYKFNDAVDGFISYVQSSYYPMDRSSILDTIKNLETISNEDLNSDLFENFIKVYNELCKKITAFVSKTDVDEYILQMKSGANDSFNLSGLNDPKSFMFASSVQDLFNKPQSFTGFGGALGVLRDRNIITSLDSITEVIGQINPGGDDDFEWFSSLNEYMNGIKKTSKKIGNSQRLFLYHFFRSLFQTEGDTYLNLKLSVDAAERKYYSEY
ncbi:hypothetical protein LJC08_04245 [Methanimicrococcus sp. OttesenSCG-928-J09]|nr:hypothetical protein [Methanimicrococcus sp. OttesenSCG-928-J09]